jgi:hypothetical protein
VAQIRQSQTLAEWAMALTSGSTKPSRLKPSGAAAGRWRGSDRTRYARDAGVDEEVGHHGDNCRAEITRNAGSPARIEIMNRPNSWSKVRTISVGA